MLERDFSSMGAHDFSNILLFCVLLSLCHTNSPKQIKLDQRPLIKGLSQLKQLFSRNRKRMKLLGFTRQAH